MSPATASAALKWVVENQEVELLSLNGEPASVEAPNHVELAITHTEPGLRGDTAQGGTKPATLETGVIVQVPLFIEEGERVRVDTRTGELHHAASSASGESTGRGVLASATHRHHRHHPARRPPVAVGDAHAHRPRCCRSSSSMDAVGFHSLECWGGATFDACLRFLDEDPWERLRVIKKPRASHAAADAAARPEPGRLPPLRRRHRAPLRVPRRPRTASTSSASSTP